MKTAWIGLVGLAAVLSIGVVFVGTRSTPPASQLVSPGEGMGVASLPGVAANTPYSFGGTSLCTTKDPIAITEVTLLHPTGGLRVVDWAVRPWSMQYLGNGPGATKGMARSFPGFRQTVISVRCSAPVPDEFVVTVEKPTSGTANADAALVHYRVDGTEYVLKQRLAIQLCGAADHSSACASAH